jgi:hypothetical protein
LAYLTISDRPASFRRFQGSLQPGQVGGQIGNPLENLPGSGVFQHQKVCV